MLKFNKIYIIKRFFKIFFLFFIFTCTCNKEMHCQNYFEKVISLSLQDHESHAVEDMNSLGYILAGNEKFSSTTQSLVCRVDANGSLLWTSAFSLMEHNQITDMLTIEDSSVLVLGHSWNSYESGIIFLIKYKIDGDTFDLKVFNNHNYIGASRIIQTYDDGYAILCTYLDVNEISSIIKLNPSGSFQWASNIGIAMINQTVHFNSFAELPDSSLFCIGSLESTNSSVTKIVRVDKHGILLLEDTIPPNWPNSVSWGIDLITDNQPFLLLLSSTSTSYYGNKKTNISKINYFGDVIWNKTLNQDSINYDFSIKRGCRGYSSNSIFLTGAYSNYIYPNLIGGAFTLKIREDTLIDWLRFYGNAINGISFDIVDNEMDEIITTGAAYDFNMRYSFYLIKTDTAGLITSTWQPGAVADRLTVSPNPVADVCRVTLPHGCSQLNLLTLQGQTLLTINTTDKSTLELSTNWLPAGLYLLRAETDNFSLIEKLLKNR